MKNPFSQYNRFSGYLCGELLAHHDHRDRLSCFFYFFDQRRNAIGNGCALANPVSDAIQIQAGAFFFFASDWVEETNALNEATVACITAVGDKQPGRTDAF
ncbi:Uncharacterised protein [Salmonella enterica subsp. enterica serovar Sanjuan]|uniref:Uncharacterized protein n=1 Tax=Salmonella enterica subsp. enterica serovar Sanjuan TaxID=1160765 RepID=A0A447NM73_SALET|nr:Uncharacterised protein [Salmonella enterica subsp. enterica serovar Sanjuan]